MRISPVTVMARMATGSLRRHPDSKTRVNRRVAVAVPVAKTGVTVIREAVVIAEAEAAAMKLTTEEANNALEE